MSDAPPTLPTEYQIYNSYEVDPTYQRKFSIVWGSVAGFFVLVALPSFIWSLRTGRVRNALIGVLEDLKSYEPLADGEKKAVHIKNDGLLEKFSRRLSVIRACTKWTIPPIGMDIGQLTLVIAYYVTILLCMTLNAELVDNPNRAGFLAIAQLPPVFLLASKNSPLAILLSTGYEKLNYLHRWCARGTLLGAAVHGALWIRNHREYGLQILGAQKETSGVAAFALLCILALTSVRPVRVHVYQVFRIIHLLVVPAFVITLCYHTLYTKPYLYFVLGFYGFDLLFRLIRFRAKDATLIAPDAQMTILRVHDCTSGWNIGQHVRLRMFIGSRMFESHPLTIMNAPRATTCLGDIGIGDEVLLGARVNGGWSRALNAYARDNSPPCVVEPPKDMVASEIVVENVEGIEQLNVVELPPASKSGEVAGTISAEPRYWSSTSGGAPVQVMLDGPYGGCALGLGTFEDVLLIAGGSGVTFTLALLDDLVGRCLRLDRRHGEVTQRVGFVWCVRSFGALRWVAPLLKAIATLAAAPGSTVDLHIGVYVTCLCKPEEVPLIPNCDVLLEKPNIRKLVGNFAHTTNPDELEHKQIALAGWSSLAVCAAGPERLTFEAKNAAARLAMRNPTRRVACHTEAYFL